MTEPPNSLMNIGDLAKPVNTLIEKISDAVEGLAKPVQILRVAKAQAEADKILAISELEITEERQRAITRLVLEEARRQENMEAIFRKSLPEITEEASPEKLERDWITHFFEKCRLISDEEMQDLWAQVLSGQTNTPGSYSKKTIEVLANLENSDAALFTTVCRFSIHGAEEELGDALLPLVYDVDDEIYRSNGLKFSSLAHLESLGLLRFSLDGGYAVSEIAQRPDIFYFNTRLPLELPSGQDQLVVGQILLTYAGQQLSSVCGIEPIDGFADYLQEKWRRFRYLTGHDLDPDPPDADQLTLSED